MKISNAFIFVPRTDGTAQIQSEKKHGFQYFSYPTYTFSYFRDHNIEKYEAPADIALNEWIRLSIRVCDEKAYLYINDLKKPALSVYDLKHGPYARGSVGLFIDIGTEGFFRNIRITCDDESYH